MCHTTVPEQEPIGPQPNINPDDPLSQTLTDATNSSPRAVTVARPTGLGRTLEVLSGGSFDPSGGEDTTTPPWNPNGGAPRLTKWGALARLIGPALQGGMIGLAGGKGHPQGGFGAANDFYARQRAYQMQYYMMARQMQNDAYRNSLEAARTQHELQMPPITRVPNAIKGRDAQGNEIYMSFNPHTMRYEPVSGISPDSNADYSTSNTDQGIVLYDKRGIAPTKQLTLPDAQPGPDGNAPTVTPQSPSQFDSGSPRIPGTGAASQSPSGIAAGAGSRIPLRPSGFNTPRVAIRSSRNAAGVETDDMYDENPNSPTFGKQVGALGNTRMPMPDRLSLRTSAADQLGSQVETYAAEALKRNGNDPDKAVQFMNNLQVGDPDAQKHLQAILPKIRQRIRDRVKQGKRHFLPPGVDPSALGLTPTNRSSVIDEDDEDNQ